MANSTENLNALSQSLADAAEKGGAYTVTVDARRRFPASGVAYGKDLILTASHVVQDEEDIRVTLPDGTQVGAKLLGRDPQSDLALLRLEKAGANPAKVLEQQPRVGQMVLALGRPTANGVQASFGIISARSGPLHSRHGGMLEAHLRSDTTPYPGFSGGPLVDTNGQLIGINTSGLGIGSSLTIPAKVAWRIAASLQEHGSVKRGFLGLRSQLVDIPQEGQKELGREQSHGLLIVGLEEGSPAAEGKLMVGDILVGLNDEAVDSHESLLSRLSGEVVGSASQVQVLRGGKAITLKVTPGEREVRSHQRHGKRHGHGRRHWRRGWGRGWKRGHR